MSKCFICKYTDAEENFFDVGYYVYKCLFCGCYGIDESLYDNMRDSKSTYIENDNKQRICKRDFYFKAPSIAAERELKGMDGYLLVYDRDLNNAQNNSSGIFTPIGIRAFLDEYPQDAIDMFNRVLMNLGHLIPRPTGKITLFDDAIDNKNQPYKKFDYLYFYSNNYVDALEVCHELAAMRWLRIDESIKGKFGIAITHNGWMALRGLQKASQDSDKVFLAMWFNEETNNLRNAVENAVRAAGYRPEEITVDTTQHNDFIMNKVINMITDAKFVIADFTCSPEAKIADGKVPGGVRGGVYFEAGLARGQGKEVIHTCKNTNEAKSRLHFDIHQINTIFWKEEKDAEGNVILKSYDSDFIDVLKHRIIATVGKGKHYKEQ